MEDRLLQYFSLIARRLTIDYKLTGIGKNPADIGYNREKLLEDFLSKHLPKRLNAYLGGYIYGYGEPDSKQIDIIVSNDIGLNFIQHDKLFTPIENVGAVITIKSYLDSKSLIDALKNVASIPSIDKDILKFKSLGRDGFDVFVDLHPTLYVFAYDGIALETAMETIRQFYHNNPVKLNRIPCSIIVNEKYYIRFNASEVENLNGQIIPPNTFHGEEFTEKLSGLPFLHILNSINFYVEWLSIMSINYTKYFDTSVKSSIEKFKNDTFAKSSPQIV